jgi:Zn-dependent peptidase ImmA (M78 family)
MELNLEEYANELIDIFNLELVVEITTVPMKNYQGFYELRLNLIDEDSEEAEYFHYIKISTTTNHTVEDYKSTLAHEFVHAWQHENRKKVKHDKHFMKWVKLFKEKYNLDISSSDCYDEEEIEIEVILEK